MNKINVKLVSTSELFSSSKNCRFNIPSLQRKFAWTKTNIQELFADFANDADDFNFATIEDLDQYLLGNIVLIPSKEHDDYDVVDGQQRLVTLSMIYKSMAARFHRLFTQYPSQSEYAVYFTLCQACYSIGINSRELRIQQSSDLVYANRYKHIMAKQYPETEEEYPEFTDIESNLYAVWQEINCQINRLTPTAFVNFTNYFRNNVMLIQTICPTPAQAFHIFEVLNNRGQPLKPIDLIKNLLLQQIPGSHLLDEFNRKWSKFVENVNVHGFPTPSSDYSSLFLKYFITYQYGVDVNTQQLVDFIKKQIHAKNINRHNVLLLVSQLAHFSTMFMDMLQNPTRNMFSTSPYMDALGLLNRPPLHPLMMLFYHSTLVDHQQLQAAREQLLYACIKVGISIFYSHNAPSKLEPLVPKLIRSFKEQLNSEHDFNAATQQLIITLTERAKSKCSAIINTLPNLRLGTKKASILLQIIEIIINRNNNIMAPQSPGREITLEHILPRKKPLNIKELGFTADDDYQYITNTIGNLTLLHHNDNSSLHHDIFNDKKVNYKDTDLCITRALVGNFTSVAQNGVNAKHIRNLTTKYECSYRKQKLWTKANIEQRGQELTRLIVDFVQGEV